MGKNGLNKITIHWTAGTGKANATDKSHYHYLIEADGNIIKGNYIPEDNANCNDGRYAAHTGGGNTGNIGIALCGMYGYQSGKPSSTKYPLTAIQCEATWKLCAELCKKYNINISDVYTHYEFGKANPKTSSAGKIDINYLPYQPEVKSNEVISFIRNKVKWYGARI